MHALMSSISPWNTMVWSQRLKLCPLFLVPFVHPSEPPDTQPHFVQKPTCNVYLVVQHILVDCLKCTVRCEIFHLTHTVSEMLYGDSDA